jgi:hypothetical protein
MKSLGIAAVATLAALLLSRPASAGDVELIQMIVLKGKAGNLDHLAIDAKRDRLFVANKVNNTLDVVDLKEGKLLEQKANQTAIQGIAYAPDPDKVFVGLGTGGLPRRAATHFACLYTPAELALTASWKNHSCPAAREFVSPPSLPWSPPPASSPPYFSSCSRSQAKMCLGGYMG